MLYLLASALMIVRVLFTVCLLPHFLDFVLFFGDFDVDDGPKHSAEGPSSVHKRREAGHTSLHELEQLPSSLT